MNKSKADRLRAAGWRIGDTQEFLGLSDQEAALIELKLDFAALLRAERLRQGLTQSALAKRIGSSQSRVAKVEAGDASVTLDLMFRSAFSLGLSTQALGRRIMRLNRKRGTANKAG